MKIDSMTMVGVVMVWKDGDDDARFSSDGPLEITGKDGDEIELMGRINGGQSVYFRLRLSDLVQRAMECPFKAS